MKWMTYKLFFCLGLLGSVFCVDALLTRAGAHIIVSKRGNVQVSSNISTNAVLSSPVETEVFFTSDGNIREKIKSFIYQEQKEISIAMYVFTDQEIAQWLIDAHKKGVKVEVIVDGKQAEEELSKVDLLVENGIDVWCYRPSQKKQNPWQPLMHNKFIILDETRRFITGSLNFTKSACGRNCENICSVVNDTRSLEKYKKEYERIKEKCVQHTSKKNK